MFEISICKPMTLSKQKKSYAYLCAAAFAGLLHTLVCMCAQLPFPVNEGDLSSQERLFWPFGTNQGVAWIGACLSSLPIY